MVSPRFGYVEDVRLVLHFTFYIFDLLHISGTGVHGNGTAAPKHDFETSSKLHQVIKKRRIEPLVVNSPPYKLLQSLEHLESDVHFQYKSL
jgi:hypothetical protein